MATEALKVLIADDDQPTRMLLRAAIKQWGYELVEASDGEEAWQILQKPEAPRLLILDWLMPKLDGLALCSRIKQEMHYHPYVILLTQLTGTTNIIKALEAGANEFLSKPFNMAELRTRLAVGARIIGYENTLAEKTQELQTSTILGNALAKSIQEAAQVLDSNETDKIGSLEKIIKEALKKVNDLKK